jgi:hypothetical protein
MQNDEDAALVDSFFLPGGILDPEDDDEGPATGISENLDEPPSLFPSVVNPHNPWAGQKQPLRPVETDSFFQSGAPFPQRSGGSSPAGHQGLTPHEQVQAQLPLQSQPEPPMLSLSDLLFPTRNTADLLPQQRPPPGFEPSKPAVMENQETTSRDDEDEEDDESIHGVPRELMHHSDRDSYDDDMSSTSSLSNSTEGNDEDDEEDTQDEEDEEDDTQAENEENKPVQAVYVVSTRKEEQDKGGKDGNEDDDGPVLAERKRGQGKEMIAPKMQSPPQAAPDIHGQPGTPGNPATDDTQDQLSPLAHATSSPVSPKQIAKAKKRRSNKKPKAKSPRQSPQKQYTSSGSPVGGKAAHLISIMEYMPILERNKATKSSSSAIPATASNLQAHGYSMIYLGSVVASVIVAIHKAAARQVLLDHTWIPYALIYFGRWLIEKAVDELNVPHWWSHAITAVFLEWLLTSAEKPRTTLILARILVVVKFVLEGFSQPHDSILMLPGRFRVVFAYALIVLRLDYLSSPFCIVSLAVQILISIMIPYSDHVLAVIGLATLHYKHNLKLQSSASRMDY